ncbi:hypothetical protein LIER_01413 [Lithospermum erythrorhizon]|uniref:Uncharacterized protein n=1 Tax=Lithospermum erythrorhizon TaxID=34254 RepID=A0AAV3NQL9_LITER
MFDLKETDPAAQTWMETNVGMPKHWCRAFFPLHVKFDMLCNNLSESFNSFILSARDKPIITMLDRIRRLCMERINDRRLAIGTKPGPLCHRISKLLDKRICFADGMSYAWNGLDGYEVFRVSGEQFKGDLRKKECSCHNVRTCPKKKAEREASGAGHLKKCTTTNKEQFPSTLERIEKEQAEHEAYLINLHNWMNEMRNIVPNVPTTQLSSQPNPNVATT